MTQRSTQLLVVGGGATGLGVAWDACLRGLDVVVLEQGDLAQGTSGRYHGLLHSGARYVVSDPPSASACALENVILRRLVPHAIEDTGGLFVCPPGDPQEFPDLWLEACRGLGVPAEEITSSNALDEEPLLSPEITRAFRVQDAALDSFDLLHALAAAVSAAGGSVLLHHRLERLTPRSDGFLAAASQSGDRLQYIHAQVVVNAGGPHAGKVAAMAGSPLPLALGRGAMIAMATRLVHTVVNRCKPPSDGDIIVPIGTVAVLGTTDTPVTSPDDVRIEPWEVDLLLREAAALIPSIEDHRVLRAWAGVRPLYRPPEAPESETRNLPRTHALIDHAASGGPSGLFTIIGGKLTTFRLMAEETVNLVAPLLGSSATCRTADTPLSPPSPNYHRLPLRLEALSAPTADSRRGVVCECELVTAEAIQAALDASPTIDLDDLRRDLRLGMGPCQAAFCAYRSAGLLGGREPGLDPSPGLRSFLEERWRGIKPLVWGHTLRQVELNRRIYQDLLGLDDR
jgi:glycerol-3-phosphate dehydrogenase